MQIMEYPQASQSYKFLILWNRVVLIHWRLSSRGLSLSYSQPLNLFPASAPSILKTNVADKPGEKAEPQIHLRRVSVEDLSRSGWPMDMPVEIALVDRGRPRPFREVPFPRQASLDHEREQSYLQLRNGYTYSLFFWLWIWCWLAAWFTAMVFPQWWTETWNFKWMNSSSP